MRLSWVKCPNEFVTENLEMLKLVEFIKKIYLPLLFLVLEIVAIRYYAHSNSYAEARLLATSNSVVGGVYGSISGVGEYFGLRKRNRVLLEEMAELQNELTRYRESAVYDQLDSLGAEVETKYSYMTARVVRNTVSRQHNFLTLNNGSARWRRDGYGRNHARWGDGGLRSELLGALCGGDFDPQYRLQCQR